MDDKIKALRLLVNGKMVFGETSIENGLDNFYKIYLELRVHKEADPTYFLTEKHILHNDLKEGDIYHLALTIDGDNQLTVGLFCLSSILDSNEDEDIINLLFHHHLSPK